MLYLLFDCILHDLTALGKDDLVYIV